MRLVAITILALSFAITAMQSVSAQTDSVLVSGQDTIRYKYTPITFPTPNEAAATSTDTVAVKSSAKKPNIFKRIVKYFAESSKDKSFDKKIDFTFVGGPSYSNSTSLSIGLLAAGLYRIDKENRSLPASAVSIYATASIIGFYKVGIEGSNIFKDDRNRLLYDVAFSSQPTDFWGLGYNAAVHNAKTSYIANKYQIEINYLHRLFKNTYIGVKTNFDYIYCGRKMKTPAYLEGQKNHYSATGLSVILEYDSRDFIPNPSRGLYVSLQEMIRPKAMGSIGSTTWTTKVTVDYYHKLWKGAILALDLYGEFNSQTTPWVFYAQMGGSQRMRGYYQGRFTDLNVIMVQAELRQRIWRRIGMTAWGGAGNVFSSFNRFEWGHTMPNYGIGLRWEFKNRVNIRADYGMGGRVQGKLISGFLFSINEAF